MDNPFTPGRTQPIAVSASSQAVKLSDVRNAQIRVCNLGTETVWIKFGGADVTAANTDMPIPAAPFVEVLTANTDGPVYVAAIAAGSTGDIVFTVGSGF